MIGQTKHVLPQHSGDSRVMRVLAIAVDGALWIALGTTLFRTLWG